LSDDCVEKFARNGPFMPNLITNFFSLDIHKYDLVHTTFFPYLNLIFSLILGKFLYVPTICTPFFHFSNPRYHDKSLVEVLSKFDLLIACTQREKEYLKNIPHLSRTKIKVIPMGVDAKIFKIPNKPKFKHFKRNKLKINTLNYFKETFFEEKEKHYQMVLFCGYKNYEKGAISLLKSIPLILKKVRNIYFVFIGPSTEAFQRELSKIKKISGVRIINFSPDNLKGYFDNKKIAAFREADVYVMPSRSDAFGIAFLEAWAARKPVIGANIGATPEIIQNEVNGLLVEFDNSHDISEKVVKLLKNKKLRNNLGTRGMQKVYQNYTWEKVVESTHLIYQEIINGEI
jgi:glycosyltransferase involved in cell wall biosynthesis